MGVNNVDFSVLDSIAGTALFLKDASPTIPDNAKGAVITVGGTALRMRDDATAPTASIGHKLEVGDVVTFDSWTVPKNNWRQVMLRARFIQAVASTTGDLEISWYD